MALDGVNGRVVGGAQGIMSGTEKGDAGKPEGAGDVHKGGVGGEQDVAGGQYGGGLAEGKVGRPEVDHAVAEDGRDGEFPVERVVGVAEEKDFPAHL